MNAKDSQPFDRLSAEARGVNETMPFRALIQNESKCQIRREYRTNIRAPGIATLKTAFERTTKFSGAN